MLPRRGPEALQATSGSLLPRDRPAPKSSTLSAAPAVVAVQGSGAAVFMRRSARSADRVSRQLPPAAVPDAARAARQERGEPLDLGIVSTCVDSCAAVLVPAAAQAGPCVASVRWGAAICGERPRSARAAGDNDGRGRRRDADAGPPRRSAREALRSTRRSICRWISRYASAAPGRVPAARVARLLGSGSRRGGLRAVTMEQDPPRQPEAPCMVVDRAAQAEGAGRVHGG